MSLVAQLTAFATAVGTDMRRALTLINGRAADLSALTTTAQGNLVAAINEVNAKPTGTGGAAINDAAASTTTTFSGTKIAADIGAKPSINNSGASTTAVWSASKVNTELGTRDTAIGNRLRVDAAQSLTPAQILQANANLDIGDPATDFAIAYSTARDAG